MGRFTEFTQLIVKTDFVPSMLVNKYTEDAQLFFIALAILFVQQNGNKWYTNNNRKHSLQRSRKSSVLQRITKYMVENFHH